MVENFSLFGSVVANLHQEFVRLYYVFLPVFFALAIAIDWFRNPVGSPDFLSTLKRAIIATLLVVGFQEISDTILELANGVADRISDLNGIDNFIKMAGEKTSQYTLSATSLILGFNDLLVAILSFLSYIILFIARYITVAIYHFMWSTLVILSPLLILFGLFRGTVSIPINLFRSLIEVACYKIVWAVLSAMLVALSFGNAMAADGNYLTVILLNLIIALAMLGTPLVVKSLIGSGLSSMSETLGAGAVMAMVSLPAKAAMTAKAGREVLGDSVGYAKHLNSKFQSATTPKPDISLSKSEYDAAMTRSPQSNPQQPKIPEPPKKIKEE